MYQNLDFYEITRKYESATREFEVRQKALLFNSRVRLFLWKLNSRWLEPFLGIRFFPYGVIEVHHETKGTFKVNGQILKLYVEGEINMQKSSINLMQFKGVLLLFYILFYFFFVFFFIPHLE